MKIPVHFPGGVAVAARIGHHVLTTDQPVGAGGAGTAASPFDLFLASLATCAGFYALRFCQSRGLPTEGLALEMETLPESAGPIGVVRLHLTLPVGFPANYRDAIERAVLQCAVKRHLDHPPQFEIALREAVPLPRRAEEVPAERALEPVAAGAPGPRDAT
jgi:ribosomal protein S12 methylthiotransferase accessory factor